MVKLFDLSKRGHSSPTSMTLNTNTNKEHADIANNKTDFKTTNYNVQHDRKLMPLSSSESREPVSLSRLPNIQSIERHHKHSLPNSFLTPTKEQTCLLLTSNYVNCVNNMELEFLPSLKKDVDGVSRKTPTNRMHEYQEEQEHNCKSNFTKCKNSEFREARLHYYAEFMSKEPNANRKVSNVHANTNITTEIASQNFTQTSSQQLEQRRCNKIKQDIDESEIHYEPHKVNNNKERTVRSLQRRQEEMYNGAISAKCEPTLSSASAQTSENFYYHHHVLHEYLAMASPLMTNNKQSQTLKSKEISSFSNNIISSSANYRNSYSDYTNVEYNKKKENCIPAASISFHEHMIEYSKLQREKVDFNSCNSHHSDDRNKINESMSKSNKKTEKNKKMNKSKEDKSEVLVSSQLCVCELPEMQNSSSQATSQSPFLTSSSLPPSHSPSFTPTPPSTTFTAIRASPFARSTSCEDSFLRSVSGHEIPMQHNVKKASVNVKLETQKCEHETPESIITMEANQSCEEKEHKNNNTISDSSSIHEVHEVNSCKATSNDTTKSYSVLYELMSELQNALGVLNEQYVRIDNDTGEIVANNIHEIKVEKIDTSEVTKETYVYVAKGNDDEVLPLLWCNLSVENVTTNHSSISATCEGDNDNTTVGITATTAISGKSKSLYKEENANNLLRVMKLSHESYVNLLSAIWLVRLILPDFPCNSQLIERSPLLLEKQQQEQQKKWLERMLNILEWVRIDYDEYLLSYWHSATHWLAMLEHFFMKCVAFSVEAKDNMEQQNKSSRNVITDLWNVADCAYRAMNEETEVKKQREGKLYKELKQIVSVYADLVQSFTDVNNLECLPESMWLHSSPRCSFIDHVTYFLRPCSSLYQFRKEEVDEERLNRVNNNTCIANTQTETTRVQKEYVYRLFMNASQFSSIPYDVFSAANSDSNVSKEEEHCENEHKCELQQSLHNINNKKEEQEVLLSSPYIYTSAQAAHLHTRLAYSFVYEAQCIDRSDEYAAVDKRGGGVATGQYSVLTQQLPEASFVDCMLMLAKLHCALWEVKHNDCQKQKMLALCKQTNSSAAELLPSQDTPVRLLNLFEEVEHDIFVSTDNNNSQPEQKDANDKVNLSSWCNIIIISSPEAIRETNSTICNNLFTCEYHSEVVNEKESSSATVLWQVVKRIKTFFVHKTEMQLTQLIQALLEDMIEQQKLQFKPCSVNEQTVNRGIMQNNQNTYPEGNISDEEEDDMQMAKDLHNIACFLCKLVYAEEESITLIDQFVDDYDKFASVIDFCHDKEMWRPKLHCLHQLLSLPVDVDTLFTYAKPEPCSSTKEENNMRASKPYGSQSNFIEAVRLQYYTHLIEYTLELQNTIVSIPLMQSAKCNSVAAGAAITYNASSEGSIVNNDSNESTFLIPVQTLDSYNIIKELSTFAETTKFCSSSESNVSTRDTSLMHTTPHKRKPLWLRRSISPSAPININNTITTTTTTTNASSSSFSSFSSSCSSPSLLAKLSSPLISSSPLMLLLLHQKRNRNKRINKRRSITRRGSSYICKDSKCELFLPASATMTLSSSSSIASSEPSSSPLSTGLSESHNIKTNHTDVSSRSDAARQICYKNAPNAFSESECMPNRSNVPQSSLEAPRSSSLSLSLSSPSHASTSSLEANSSQESREGSRSQLYRLDTQTPHHPEKQKYKLCDDVSKLENNNGDRQNTTITFESELLEEEIGVHDEVERQGSISVPTLSTYSINSSSTPTLSIVTTSVEPNSPISPEFSEKLSYDNKINGDQLNNKYDDVFIPQSADNLLEESKKSNSTIDMYRDISIVNSPTSIHESTLPFTHAMQIMSSIKGTTTRNNESIPVNTSSSINSFNNNEGNDDADDNRKVGESALPSLFVPLRIVFNTLVNFCTHKSSHEVAEYLHHLLLLYTEKRNIENEECDSQTNKNNNDNDSGDAASSYDKVGEQNKELSLTILQQCTDEELFGPLLLEQSSSITHTVSDRHNYLCDEHVVNVQDLASLCTLVLFY